MPADPVLPHYHTPNTPSLYTTTCQFPSNLLTPHIYNPTVPSLKWKEMYLWQYKPILYKVLQSIIQYYLLCAETNKRFYYYYYYYYMGSILNLLRKKWSKILWHCDTDTSSETKFVPFRNSNKYLFYYFLGQKTFSPF